MRPIGVSTNPGCTALTRMPSFAQWMAAFLVMRRTAPFDAWYASGIGHTREGMLLAFLSRMQLGTVHPGSFNGSPTLDAELLAQEMRSGRKLVIVDVRNKDEFCEGHIAGARWIPIHQLVARASEITTDRSAPVVCVSRSGRRAEIAAAALRLAGFPEVATLAGGMHRWTALALAVTRIVGA
jgi:rhodanese-related sulfurtransferase